MTSKSWQRIFSFLVLAGLLLSLTKPGVTKAKASVHQSSDPLKSLAASQHTVAKIENQLMDDVNAKGQSDFIVVMKEQADLSGAGKLITKVQKGDYVYNTLRVTADSTQKSLRAYLDKQNIQYKSYYIVNAILVTGGTKDQLLKIAGRSDVASVSANHTFQAEREKPLLKQVGPDAPADVEPNLSFVKADQVWATGDIGAGVVLAGNDTGLDWSHPAIQPHYRGWDGSMADHNYNWWSAVPGTYPEPQDNMDPGWGGYGTLSTGIMVGDDGGGNQIGMAPGARTIHCKNQTNPNGESQDAWYIECFEWDLAPWDLSGNYPRPDLAPDAVNVDWSNQVSGSDPVYRIALDALLAAGIVVDTPAGDDGAYCANLETPGEYQEVLTVGSVDSSSGDLPGTLSSFSSRGPSSVDGNYFPDVMAPGEEIRTSSPGGGYSYVWGSTRGASAHVAGLIALIWSVSPVLRGNVETTMQIIKDTAVPLSGQNGSSCGGDYTNGPNNDWGYGTIDALAAVEMARNYHGGTLDGTVTSAFSGDPIQGASIQATLNLTRSFNTTTDASGMYSMKVLTGTYTVEAGAFGYLPEQTTGVSVTQDMTTTVDFALYLAPSHVLSVTVVDANTGWPLYAQIAMGGTPLGTVWTDPATGHYEVSLPDGWAYTLGVDAWTPGYLHNDVTVGPFYSDTEVTIELQPDLVSCTAPGYHFVPAPMFSTDFEANDGGFYMGGNDSSWEWGAPTSGPGAAHSGVNVWATNLDGNYNSYENSYLVSPIIDLSSQAGKPVFVSWWQWLQTRPGDYAWVEASIDGGDNWYFVYGGGGNVDLSWGQHSLALDPSYAVGNFQVRIHLASYDYQTYPGWYIDDVAVGANLCEPMEGGLVVGNVINANGNVPLLGATVANDSGFSTLTAATPDPTVDGSLYVLFSPSGSHVFTATFSTYTPDVETVAVELDDTVQQDFTLTAGHLVVDPLTLPVSLEIGHVLTQTLTLTNNGSAPLTYAIVENDLGSTPALKANVSKRVDPASPMALIKVLLVTSDFDLDYDSPLQDDLLTYWDIGVVDLFDARNNTPTLDQLLAYDVVVTWPAYYGYSDPYGLGNVLADYVDAGGKVINAMYSMNAWGLQGRFMDENYTAMKGSYETNYSACLGIYDSTHPVMEGITYVCDRNRLEGSYLTPGATAVAHWDDGDIFVAVKDNGTVVSLGMYVGYDFEWSGQAIDVVHNAIRWLAGPLDAPWLSEDPITGTLPISGTQNVNVVFDAGIPEITQPGTFYAQLQINQDTPYPDLNVPVTMTVTAPPTYGKLEGTVRTLGYCNQEPEYLYQPNVLVHSSLGVTWTLETDDVGHFQIWMDQANSPLTITVTANHQVGQTVTGVIITGQQTTTVNFDLLLEEPCVSETPSSIEASLTIGNITTTQITLGNSGGRATDFTISELNRGYSPVPQGSRSLVGSDASTVKAISAFAGEPVFAVDLDNAELLYFPDTNRPDVAHVLGDVADGLAGGDFLKDDFSKMYVLSSNDNSLYTIAVSNLEFVRIGSALPLNSETWKALTASADGILYASATSYIDDKSMLYTIDPATGAATVVGEISGAKFIAGLAINTAGQMYGVDLYDDTLVQIDPATGAAAEIGYLGVEVEYTQSLAFDDRSGVLYWAAQPYYSYDGELRTIDTSTGDSTLIGYFYHGSHMGCLAFAGQAAEVPWIYEQPVTGTLDAVTGQQAVTVTMDGSAVPQPGSYAAQLFVLTEDPYSPLDNVWVNLNVEPSADWGQIAGSVNGLGYCDQGSVPLPGAQVVIESASGSTYDLTADSSGDYQRWLLVAGGPYTVTASASGYQPASVGNVQILSLGTTQIDLDLHWLRPCVSVATTGIKMEVPLGKALTTTLNLLNSGAGAASFMMSEIPGSLLGKVTRRSASSLIGTVAIFKDSDPWGYTAVENILTANGIPYEVHGSSEFGLLNFNNYSMIVFSSDQPSSFYDAYATYVDKFDSYVQNGGFLNFFTAPGSNGGTLYTPLPGGMVWQQYYEYYNHIDDPAHPVMEGMVDPFSGPWDASFGHFTSLPANAHIIASEQSNGLPTIVEYQIGAGRLIAFTQPLEVSYSYGWDIGQILENTLSYGCTFEPGVDVPWLAVEPISGTIPADGSFPEEVTFTASPTMTVGDVYTASILLQSDDPVNSRIMVPVTMTVVAAPVYTYGVEASADQTGSGQPGSVVTYTVTVTNTGNAATDSFTVTLGAHVYTTGLGAGENPSIVVGSLVAGESVTFVVTVHIPAGAADGDHDGVSITVTSAGDPTKTAIVTMTTNVFVVVPPPQQVYLPLIGRAP